MAHNKVERLDAVCVLSIFGSQASVYLPLLEAMLRASTNSSSKACVEQTIIKISERPNQVLERDVANVSHHRRWDREEMLTKSVGKTCDGHANVIPHFRKCDNGEAGRKRERGPKSLEKPGEKRETLLNSAPTQPPMAFVAGDRWALAL